MKCLWMAGLGLSAMATACRKEPPRDAMASLPGVSQTAEPRAMEDMAGMGNMKDMGTAPGASGDSAASVRIDRAAAARAGITFARASMRPVGRDRRVVGTLSYAEPRRQYVNARVMGWIERLDADYEGKPVRKGDPLLALYSPELVSAQEEYLSARRLGDSTLSAAALRRLALWDIPGDQIRALERDGTAQRTLILRAPISGEIAEKMVTAGQAVHAGDNLFLIADRSVLWAELAIFEADARVVRVGTPVSVTVDALPGRSYVGKVTFIQPTVDEKTRTLTARLEVANGDGALRPGMFVTAEVVPSGLRRLSVPEEAVLPTGTRNLVFVNRGDGQFEPREVAVGVRGDSLVEIAAGLKPGDEVVASATYLLDSESNLAAAMQGLMLQMGMGLNMGGMDMGPGQGMGDMKGTPMQGGGAKAMKMDSGGER
jgi:membrane fusion protein, copper/silver efflux system